MQKILYILRHAKTEPTAPGREDHERRLVPRGIADAERVGEYMAAQGIRPQRVLCSTAVRCRETAEAIFPSPSGRRWREAPDEGGATGDALAPTPLPVEEGIIQYTDRLYLTSPNQIIALLREVPESCSSLMVIGHNPGLHELCLGLARDGDNDLRSELSATFPTCALATLAFNGTWRDIGRMPATLAGFVTPKAI